MAIFKFLGSWFFAAAALALVNDLTRAVVPGARFAFLSMRGLWLLVHEGSLTAVQGGLQRAVHPVLWDPLALGVLKLPAWFVLGIVGAFLCYLGRKRRRIELYTN